MSNSASNFGVGLIASVGALNDDPRQDIFLYNKTLAPGLGFWEYWSVLGQGWSGVKDESGFGTGFDPSVGIFG